MRALGTGAAEAATGSAAEAQPLNEKANSFISLGAFETMGGDEGRAATGIAYMQEALQLQEASYTNEESPIRRGRKALSLAQSLLQIGQQHHQQQDAQEALTHYERARGFAEEFLALNVRAEEAAPPEEGKSEGTPQAPSSATKAEGAAQKAIKYASFVLSEICSSLGVAYNDVGRQDEALEAHQTALTLRRETVGKDHPSVAECLNNLGALFFARGALEKAADHYEQALERFVVASQGRQEGAYVALTLYNIGVCRAGLGQRREAGVALQRALKIAKQAFGENHRQIDLIRETIKQQEEQQQQQHRPQASREASPKDAE